MPEVTLRSAQRARGFSRYALALQTARVQENALGDALRSSTAIDWAVFIVRASSRKPFRTWWRRPCHPVRIGLSGAATPVAVDQAGYSGNFVVLSDGVNRSCFGRCPQGMQKVAAPTWGTRILAEDPAAVIQAFLLAVRNLSFVQEADGVPICQGATSLTITSDKARLSWRRREARDSARRPDRYSDSLARNRKRQSRTPASRHGLPPWCLPRRRALRAPKVSTRLPAPSN